MTGPYDTERQAHADVAAVGHGKSALRRHLVAACTESGVPLGDFDLQIIDWLADWEPETVQVIAGLIRRAHQAGKDSA